MSNKNIWKSIKELREVDRVYNGMYTYDYYLKNKANDKEDNYSGAYYNSLDKNPKSVHVQEKIFLRKVENNVEYTISDTASNVINNSTAYLKVFDLYEHAYDKEIKTKFGKFVNDNQGEFGGELITPSGKHLNGNFIHIFEFGDNVYAIDSLTHMVCRDFNLYKFTSKDNYELIYKAHADFDKHDNRQIGIDTLCINYNKVFFIEAGFDWEIKKHIFQITSLDIDGTISNEFYSNEIDINACSSLYYNGKLYIGADKTLLEININTKDYKIMTCLSEEDIKNMEEAI